MRKDIVVAKIGYDGYGEIVGWVGIVDVIRLAKDLDEFLHEHFV